MSVLKAIGAFFAKIGRWIKETAWVQPLLIVGGVFIIIFSISPITKWVQSWFDTGDAATAYFQNETFYKSLQYCEDGKSSSGDGLFNYIENWSSADEATKNKYGTKFWVAIVEEDCASCESTYKGFEVLQSNWNKDQYKPKDNKPFKLHTIFADQENEDNNNLNYFTNYFFGNHSSFFEMAASCTTDSPYYNYKLGSEGTKSSYYASLQNLGGAASDNTAPIFFLVDLENEEVAWQNQYGITCVLFTFTNDDKCGSTSYDKASYLMDCWNYTGVFANNN